MTKVGARVVRAGYVAPAASPAPAPAPVQAAPAPLPAPAVATKTTADKLRELKQLRDENLITQELYEAKQRDIMNTP